MCVLASVPRFRRRRAWWTPRYRGGRGGPRVRGLCPRRAALRRALRPAALAQARHAHRRLRAARAHHARQ
eukprot:scaffold18369_cov60-Phaeocystis_antarctica.AAC.3